MHIQPTSVERWLDEWRTSCEFDLGDSVVDPLSIADLVEVVAGDSSDLATLLNIKMSYGDIEGSGELLDGVLGLFEQQSRENVIVTQGAVGANALVHRALVDNGDRVISIVPAYHHHHSLPTSIDADIRFLRLREENDWLPDLSELRELARPGTKLIALSNPNNPTGSLIDQDMLNEIIAIARSCGAWVLCDEVFRGSDHSGSGTTSSIADIYEKGISTGSLSKVYSLAGLRVGWIAAPPLVIEDVTVHRDSDTIAIGLINAHLALYALKHHRSLLERSRAMTRNNLPILADWVDQERRLSWVRPRAGTMCLIKFDLPMTSKEFCTSLMRHTGVLITPGSVFDMEGYVRIGYGISQECLTKGLQRISDFLESLEVSQRLLDMRV